MLRQYNYFQVCRQSNRKLYMFIKQLEIVWQLNSAMSKIGVLFKVV